MHQLAELDDSLLRLLPRIAPLDDRAGAMRKLLGEFLRDCTRVFAGDVSRAAILHAEADQLVPWVTYQMPEESVERTRFSIGEEDPTQRRGAAGEAFVTGQLRVVHFSEVDGQWKADDPSYIEFDPARPFPPYRSFVTVPIIGTYNRSIGVLCFDSMDPTIFDPPAIRELLSALGQRIAAAILIYRELEETWGGEHDPQ